MRIIFTCALLAASVFGQTQNIVSVGAENPPNTVEPFVVGTGGVALNTCVKLDGSTPEKVIENTTSDHGCYGVAQATVAASGYVLVTRLGRAIAITDGAATQGDLLVASTTTGGYVHDSGQTSVAGLSAGTQAVGVALASAASSGSTLQVTLIPATAGSSGGGFGTTACFTPSGAGGTGAVTLSFAAPVNCDVISISVATTVTLPTPSSNASGPYLLRVQNVTPTASPFTYAGAAQTSLPQPTSEVANAVTEIWMYWTGSAWEPAASPIDISTTAASAGSILASNYPVGPPVAANASQISAPLDGGTGGGTAQAQTVTLSPAAASLTSLHFRFKPANANTGAAPTVAVNSLTAKTVTKCGTTALAAGDLAAGVYAELSYDGTEYQLMNPQAAACGASGGGSTGGYRAINLSQTGNNSNGSAIGGGPWYTSSTLVPLYACPGATNQTCLQFTAVTTGSTVTSFAMPDDVSCSAGMDFYWLGEDPSFSGGTVTMSLQAAFIAAGAADSAASYTTNSATITLAGENWAQGHIGFSSMPSGCAAGARLLLIWTWTGGTYSNTYYTVSNERLRYTAAY